MAERPDIAITGESQRQLFPRIIVADERQMIPAVAKPTANSRPFDCAAFRGNVKLHETL